MYIYEILINYIPIKLISTLCYTECGRWEPWKSSWSSKSCPM